MEKIPIFEKSYTTTKKNTENPSEQLFSLDKHSEWFQEKAILNSFSPEEVKIIKDRRNVLSSLAYFVGKNFSIKILLGLPNENNPSGWSWGKRKNGERYIQMNVHDLLDKPMDYLQYVTTHEAGHERVSRLDFIPLEEWSQPGFSFMMNSIEDPRMNNFVAESYPLYQQWMDNAYKKHLGFEKDSKEIAGKTLGFTPRHMQAGCEYIQQWLREGRKETFKINDTLPADVKEVVGNTLKSAADSWKTFPTRQMADGKEFDELGLIGENSIVAHAHASYEINKNEVWPEFRKLMEADVEDQKVQETLQDMQKQNKQETTKGDGIKMDGQGEQGGGANKDEQQDKKDGIEEDGQQEKGNSGSGEQEVKEGGKKEDKQENQGGGAKKDEQQDKKDGMEEDGQQEKGNSGSGEQEVKEGGKNEGEQEEQGGAGSGEQAENKEDDMNETEQSGGIPQDLQDKLSPEEQKELTDAIKNAIEETEKRQKEKIEAQQREDKESINQEAEETESSESEAGTGQESENENSAEGEKDTTPVPLDSLTEELKDKIKEYIESLPEETKKEITERATRAIKEFDDILNKDLQGKFTKNPEQKKEDIAKEGEKKEEKEGEGEGAGDLAASGIYSGELPHDPVDAEHGRAWRDRVRKEVAKDINEYERYRREVLALIEKTEFDLRRILINEESAWQTGFRTGKRIDIQRRIQEKVKDVSVLDSKAWQKREHPREKEYAFSVLVDLSGSMRERRQNIRKIDETFKSVIVFSEALNRLGINTEVIGFNDEMYEYQNFGQAMSDKIREKMSGMFKEVEASCCSGCGNEHRETDLGWATQTAMERLLSQQQDKKMLIILSDGMAAESPEHSHKKYDLENVKKEMLEKTNVVPIDIGNVAGKTVDEIAEELKGLIEQKK